MQSTCFLHIERRLPNIRFPITCEIADCPFARGVISKYCWWHYAEWLFDQPTSENNKFHAWLSEGAD